MGKLFLREAVLTRIVNKAFLCGEVYISQDQILLTETNSEPETEVGVEHRELVCVSTVGCLLRWVHTTPVQEWGETILLEARLH